MKKKINIPIASVQLSLSEVCKIMTEQTGKEITPETHWVESSIEMVRDGKPYAMVKFNAFAR